jgi:hypothetical protein
VSNYQIRDEEGRGLALYPGYTAAEALAAFLAVHLHGDWIGEIAAEGTAKIELPDGRMFEAVPG